MFTVETVVRKARRVTPPAVRSRIRSSVIAMTHAIGLEVVPRNGATPAASVSANLAIDTSQHGEVSTLRSLLRDGFPQMIVDVGAYDGEALSNSRPFILEGWRAVVIEPVPKQFERLHRLYAGNPHVQCVNKACGDTTGSLPLYLGSDGPDSMMATLCTDDNAWFSANRATEHVNVAVDTLTGVLDDAGAAGEIGILLVDAEGMDYEVLRGLDMDRYRPRIILTEEYISNPEKHNLKYRLLLDRGYTFWTMVGCNTIWVGNEWVRSILASPNN